VTSRSIVGIRFHALILFVRLSHFKRWIAGGCCERRKCSV